MIVPAVIVSATLVILFTLVHFYLYPSLKAEKIKKRLSSKGVEAEAVLLGLEQTGHYIDSLPQVKLQMKVQTSSGRNFISETREVMSLVDMAQLPVGCILKVRYNPCNMKEIMLVR